MKIITQRLVFALIVLILLMVSLSGCFKTHVYFYYHTYGKVRYETGFVHFYLYQVIHPRSSDQITHNEGDSVNKGLDVSRYLRISLQNINKSNDERTIPPTFLKADSIKIIPKSPFEFPEFHGLEQITIVSKRRNSKIMKLEPIIVPRDYKDDFEIEYILSVYSEKDSTLLMREPVKLRVEYKSRTYKTPLVLPANDSKNSKID